MKNWLVSGAVAFGLMGAAGAASPQGYAPECVRVVADLCGTQSARQCLSRSAMWKFIPDNCMGDVQTMVEMDREAMPTRPTRSAAPLVDDRAAARAKARAALATATRQSQAKKTDMAFKVFISSSRPVTHFQTVGASTVSSNWLKTPVPVGGCRGLVFKSGEAACSQRTRITFLGGTTREGVINYCGGKDVLYVTNSEIWIE